MALAAAAPSAAHADETVEAGALRVRVAERPFALSVTDAAGRPVLTGGMLRVSDATGTRTALRAERLRREGDAALADVVLDGGALLRLRVAPAAEGVVAVRAEGADAGSRVGVAFDLTAGEALTGFGERSNAVDFRGLDVLDYVADGPFREEDRAYVRAITPPWGSMERDDDTYYPIPWALSSRGYGVLLDNDETSRFDVGRAAPGRWSAEVEAPALALRIFGGPRPADALRRFTAATGRQPAADAPWVYGPWVQSGQPNVVPPADELAIIKALRDADAPGLRAGDPDALPPLRRAARAGGGRAHPGDAVARQRAGPPRLPQPAPLPQLPARVRPGGGRGRPAA